jgi:phage FluMu protein Com
MTDRLMCPWCKEVFEIKHQRTDFPPEKGQAKFLQAYLDQATHRCKKQDGYVSYRAWVRF